VLHVIVNKRKAVTTAFDHPVIGQKSDREIARTCKVCHPFVAKVRKLIEKAAQKGGSDDQNENENGNGNVTTSGTVSASAGGGDNAVGATSTPTPVDDGGGLDEKEPEEVSGEPSTSEVDTVHQEDSEGEDTAEPDEASEDDAVEGENSEDTPIAVVADEDKDKAEGESESKGGLEDGVPATCSGAGAMPANRPSSTLVMARKILQDFCEHPTVKNNSELADQALSISKDIGSFIELVDELDEQGSERKSA